MLNIYISQNYTTKVKTIANLIINIIKLIFNFRQKNSRKIIHSLDIINRKIKINAPLKQIFKM